MKCLELLKVWKALPFGIMPLYTYFVEIENLVTNLKRDGRLGNSYLFLQRILKRNNGPRPWRLPYLLRSRSQGQTIGLIRRLKVGGPDPLWSRSKGARGMATGHSKVPYCCACLPVEGAAEFEIRCSPPPILLWRIYTGMSLLWGGWCCAPQNCT